MNAFVLVSVTSFIGLAIIFIAEMLERHYAGFNQRDHEGLVIVKWSVVAFPLIVASLRLMPELCIASAVIFLGKIIITSFVKRFA